MVQSEGHILLLDFSETSYKFFSEKSTQIKNKFLWTLLKN